MHTTARNIAHTHTHQQHHIQTHRKQIQTRAHAKHSPARRSAQARRTCYETPGRGWNPKEGSTRDFMFVGNSKIILYAVSLYQYTRISIHVGEVLANSIFVRNRELGDPLTFLYCLCCKKWERSFYNNLEAFPKSVSYFSHSRPQYHCPPVPNLIQIFAHGFAHGLRNIHYQNSIL
jgi:hypothetical protein